MKQHRLVLIISMCYVFTAEVCVFGADDKCEISGELKKWHDVTLTFTGPDGGLWNDANWTGGEPGDVPGATDNAVVPANTVSVAADASAYALTVDGGGVAVADAQTLTIGGGIHFAAGSTLGLGLDATLAVGGGGTIDSVTTAGHATSTTSSPSGITRVTLSVSPEASTARANVTNGMPSFSAISAGTTPWSSSEAWRPQSTRSAPPVFSI